MANEENVDYNQAVKTIDEMEGENEETKSVMINTKEALSYQIDVGTYDYNKACKEIEITEGGKIPAIEEPTAKQIQEAKAKQVPVKSVTKESFDAAKEIKQLIGGAGKEFDQVVEEEAKKINKEKLVLPTLSLQDQIHELEGIKEGLDNKAFTQYQLSIVRSEVIGLSEQVRYEKIKSKDQFQRSLIELRNKLLTELGNKFLSVNT